MALNTPLVALQSVTVAFGALRAVDGVSLAVPAGQRRAIIGPNGAGKTTLFNALAGVLPTAEGRIMLRDRDITRLRMHRRAALGIGRTFQITNLFAGLTVEENLQLGAQGLSARKFSLFGSGRPDGAEVAAIEQALQDSGLAGKRHHLIRTLSYGEQRQLELALALVNKPSLLLLDEPAAGLSPAERVKMAALIRALPREVTLILIEHDMDLALGLVDFVTCLHFGRVLCEGAPDAIRTDERVQEVYLGTPHRDLADA
ncbi:MAG TPA: ABC transporter ATP-binding protein [Xanthobacteraceae bacterium]|nr:ABC transporter ATP-binding protein [Xanthobacteraceae bacterium]